MAPDLRVFPDAGALATAAAREVARLLAAAIEVRGFAAIALAGGNTPRALYAGLAAAPRDDLRWKRVDVFWGDERAVPLDDPRSNYRMAWETLLQAVPIPSARVHPIDVAAGGAPDPQAAAIAYERTLRTYFRGHRPAFDVVLLGLGEDGHTASLFPGSAALAERSRWVVPAEAPPGAEPRERVTLTLPALGAARAILVVVAGAAKADALRRALAQPPDPACPASLLATGEAPVTWWVDEEAAAGLGAPGDRAGA